MSVSCDPSRKLKWVSVLVKQFACFMISDADLASARRYTSPKRFQGKSSFFAEHKWNSLIIGGDILLTSSFDFYNWLA